MKAFKFNIFIRLLLILLTVCAIAWLYILGHILLSIILCLLFIAQLIILYLIFRDIVSDYSNFTDAIHYRDFSQHYSIRKSPTHLKLFRTGFNDIVLNFKKLSKEKETQYQHIQNVLELANTGIIAFELSSGEIIWANSLMRSFLQLPQLKNLKRIKNNWPIIYAEFYQINSGEQKVIQFSKPDTTIKLLLSANVFIMEERKFKLISVQNIEEAIDITESESWNKLLRVLTHEIMNSIAPITSVADTLQQRLQTIDVSRKMSLEDFTDIQDGIATIKSRSKGLLRFSESYRNLNRIDHVNLSVFYIRDSFESLLTLMLPTLQQKQISLEIILKNPNLQLEADQELMEQLLLNLLLNAMDAVKESHSKQIILSAELNASNNKIIRIVDTGIGMSQEILDRIYIPFFSTKKAGSGIGLSLCKQIMLLHKGSMHVKSKEGEGTTFTLQF